jgi:Flp pilus assembly protein TadD/ketosteroid isomerase-like protein
MPIHRCFSTTRTRLHTVLMSFGLGLVGSFTLPLGVHAQITAATPAASPESLEIQRLIREGQHAQALKLIDDALSKNPKDAQMRFRRGVALSMLDRKAEALGVFQKLVDDFPEMPAPYNNMAVIYGSMGDYDKARQALDKAIRTNPAYGTAYQNLGDVYAQLASQAYNKALQLDKSDTSVPPKLALLRELTSGPNMAPAMTPARKPTPLAAPPVPASAPVVIAPAVALTRPARPASESSAPATPKEAGKPETTAAEADQEKSAAAKGKSSTTPTAEIEQAVRSWATAWSSRDMNGYYAAYTPEFKGQASSRKAWEQERKDRIAARKKIKIDVSDLKIKVDGDTATARFRQSYSSDSLSTTGRKTLELQRSNRGKWQIKQESVGG